MQTAAKPTGPDAMSAGPANARLLKLLLPSILALVVVRLWLMPLPSSFWIDEMATVFVVHNGAKDASLQVAPQVAQSIYYFLPGMLAKFFGNSEVAYRIPSVLAMAAALFFIFRLAVRFIHPEAGWFAVFACLSLRGINYQAADARPYALGTCIAAGSLLLLIRWLDSGRFVDGLLFVAAASLLWRVHLVYWPFYGVYVAYTISRMVRAETKVRIGQAALIFALLGAALLPVAFCCAGAEPSGPRPCHWSRSIAQRSNNCDQVGANRRLVHAGCPGGSLVRMASKSRAGLFAEFAPVDPLLVAIATALSIWVFLDHR